MKSVVVMLALALALAACPKKSEAPPPKPSEVVIAAMRDYCKIGELPRERQREALKAWGWTNGADAEVGPIWNRAAVKKDPAAIAVLRAAADAAVGPGNCPLLDALEGK